MNINTQTKSSVYPLRLDFFWRSISIYAIALFAYAFIKGSFETSSITIQFNDPIVILLAIFIVCSAISHLYNWYAMREIVIDERNIIFRNRWRSKKIDISEITLLRFSRELSIKNNRRTRRLPVRIVTIRLKSDDRNIRFRLSSYLNQKRLYEDLLKIKEAIKERKKSNL